MLVENVSSRVTNLWRSVSRCALLAFDADNFGGAATEVLLLGKPNRSAILVLFLGEQRDVLTSRLCKNLVILSQISLLGPPGGISPTLLLNLHLPVNFIDP